MSASFGPPSRLLTRHWLTQVISTARTCNLILVVLDCLKPISHKKLIEHELEGFGIRLNKQPPGITFRRKEKGGLSFTTTIANPRLDLDSEPPCCLRSRCCRQRTLECQAKGSVRNTPLQKILQS